MLDLLNIAFTDSGYEAEIALNGFVALQKVNKNPQRFQLIITDIRMPGMDGFQFIEQIRRAGYTGPVMVYAGMLSADDHQRLKELSVARIVAKPARPYALIAIAREIQAEHGAPR